MAGPLFTLLTDFGAGSGYPAQMKAVLLAAHPDARIVDLSHDVPHYDVLAGALLLEACVPWFPLDATHVAVVDPEVGTTRRALCVVDAEGRRLVGPDNGLFTPFLVPGARVREIAPGAELARPASATFHGRDLFAPAATFLAGGGAPERLGAPVEDAVRLAWPAAERRGREVHGDTLAADAFGNLVTAIRVADLRGAEVAAAFVRDQPVSFARTFGEVAPGELVVYAGSGGRIEVAVREGSAAKRLGTRGVPVRLVLA